MSGAAPSDTHDAWAMLDDVVNAYVSDRTPEQGGDSPRAMVLYAIQGVRQFVERGAGDRPPAPRDADARYKAALRDTAQRAGIKAYWDYLDALPAIEQAQAAHQANALLDCVNAALFAVESFGRQRAGAVRPTPRAAPPQ